MILSIIDGISLRLDEYFGDDYKIYLEAVEQGVRTPCFFVKHEETMRKKLIGERYLARYKFDINYFPKNDKHEMLSHAELLEDCLGLIELPDGDLVRGRGMRFSIKDGILHFYVEYVMILMAVGVKDFMGSMDYRIF